MDNQTNIPAEGAVVDNPITNEGPIEQPSGEQVAAQASQGFDYENATRDERRSMVESFFMEPAPTEETPPEPVEQTTPEEGEVTTEEKGTEPPEQGAKVPAKFLNADGSVNVEALAKSYVEGESKLGEQGNRIGDYNRQIQELSEKLQQYEQLILKGGYAPAQDNSASEPGPEPEAEFNSEKWFDEFYEDPRTALQKLFQDAVSQAVQPFEPMVRHFQEERERNYWQEEVARAQEQYPDFDQYRARAAEILKEQPHLLQLPNAIETCYKMAKGEVLGSQVEAQPSLEEMMKDPNFIAQLSQNPEIQKQVLKGYSEKASSQPKPTVMGTQPGGVSTFTPPPEIRSVKDATRAFKDFLMRGEG